MNHLASLKSAAALAALITVFLGSGTVFAGPRDRVNGPATTETVPADRALDGPRADGTRWDGEALAREPAHSARERAHERTQKMRDRFAGARAPERPFDTGMAPGP